MILVVKIRRFKHVFLFAFLVTSIYVVIHVNPDLLIPNYFDGPVKVTRISNPIGNFQKPIILIWNKYFGGEWPQMMSDLPCHCSVTTDRSLFNSSSAVVFHLRDFDIRDVPEYHLQHQKFVLYNLESPCYSTRKKTDFELFEDNIDWSMTYRTDSDIYTPYAEKLPKDKNDPSNEDEKERKYLNSNLFHGKTKMVAWFVSNCDTCSNRESFVSALEKFIPIDIYGSCGSFKCNDRSFCYQMLESRYKFYLSFENSMCKDYITEKVFNLLNYHIIPIVLGPSSDYRNILPDNSFIDSLNFSNPGALADFLNQVADNESMYSSYFDWKSSYRYQPFTVESHFCKLCHKLSTHSIESPPLDNYRRDLVNWWFSDANCMAWHSNGKLAPTK